MAKEAAKIISNAMQELNIEYSFGTYAGNPIVYPYFVGEYSEVESFTEDGLQEGTFILNGFSRGTWLELEEKSDNIRNYFNSVSGKTVITSAGSAVAIFYATSHIVPTGDAELKRVQINLTVKEWKVY